MKLHRALKRILKDPVLILILGRWRSGKTDVALYMAEKCLSWGLIDKVASNIYTNEDPRITYVVSLPHLRRWLHMDRSKKLYLFDEALAHLPSRGAMSKKNIEFIKILAEVSKGHGRIIIISQTDKIDSTLKDSTFLRLVIYKITKKVMIWRSPAFKKPLKFIGIPRTSVKFDKDRLAEFSEKESLLYSDLSPELRSASLYVEGYSFRKIGEALNLHDEQVKRNIKKVLKAYLQKGTIQILKEEASESPREAPIPGSPPNK